MMMSIKFVASLSRRTLFLSILKPMLKTIFWVMLPVFKCGIGRVSIAHCRQVANEMEYSC
jgi:hypothetical protein